jgi:signal transduction histidine kinase
MTRRRTLSTGAQLTGLLVGLVFVGFLVAGWIALRISTGEQIRQIDQSLIESVNGANDIITTLDEDQLVALQKLPSSITVRQVDRDGRPLPTTVFGPVSTDTIVDLSSRSRTELLALTGKPFTTDNANGAPVRAIAATSDTGFFVATTSLKTVRASQDRLATQLALVGLGIGTAVGLLIWGGIGTILAPLRTMISNARRIGAGEHDIALDLGHGASEVRELGTSLDDMRRSLADSAHRLQRFAADASHDLRTPIAIIRGHTQLAQQGAPSPQAWEDIDRESKRMQQLVDDLWLLARLDQRDDPVTGLVDLTDIAAAAVSGARIIDDGWTYTWKPSKRPALTMGDERQLRRVIDNLLANVRAHTPRGTTATVSVAVTDTAVQCTVADNGPGMDDDERVNATERFWRADRSRREPGSGLGLAIVQSIIQTHHGRVTVASAPPSGLSVTIELPTARTPLLNGR